MYGIMEFRRGARRGAALAFMLTGAVVLATACGTPFGGGTASDGDDASAVASGGGARGASAAGNGIDPGTSDGDTMDHGAMDHGAMTHDAMGHDANAPGRAAVRFGESVFGLNGGDYGITLAPDGQSIFFTRAMPTTNSEAIYFTRRAAGGWTEPAVAPFSGSFHDKEPYFSPDGRRLYFASRRPQRGSSERRDFDIWYVARHGEGWGEPHWFEIVSSTYDDDYPAVAEDGTFVFGRNDASGNVDLWIAEPRGNEWSAPRPLPRPINSVYADADPWISPDGGSIVFTSPRLVDGSQGQGDLYIAHRRDDSWTDPVPLGLQVNTIAHEYGPALSADGQSFYFSRGFGGQVWVMPRSSLPALDGDGRP